MSSEVSVRQLLEELMKSCFWLFVQAVQELHVPTVFAGHSVDLGVFLPAEEAIRPEAFCNLSPVEHLSKIVSCARNAKRFHMTK